MIVIVGGGPVGCFLGYLLAKAGKKVSIYEEHSSIGKPIQCTGIVTKELANIIQFKKDFLINKLNKAEIYSYNNQIQIKVEEYVLDRSRFDQHLANLAVKNGTRLFLNTKVIEINKNQITIKDKKGIKKIKADIIIGADGPNSIVSKKINNIKKENYIGLQARVKGNFESDKYKTYFGSNYPEFFAWVVPESKNMARIGLASKNNVKYRFNRFLKKLKVKNKDIIDKQAGLIPIYNKRIKVQKENTYLIGDAASQVKATTGGGLVFGLKSAKILADCIIKKKNYEKALKSINRELYIHLFIRNILNKFNDKDFSNLIKLMNKEKIKKILKQSSREYPSKLMIKLLLIEPRFILFARKILF